MSEMLSITVGIDREGFTHVRSEDLPGLILSGEDRERIIAGVLPAVHALLEHRAAARLAALEAENARLRDKAENVVIAFQMGWDMDGVIEALRGELPMFNAARAPAPAPDANTVPMPQNADQAVLMWLIGERWVRENAPERLRSDAPAPAPAYVNKDGPCDRWAPGAYEVTAPAPAPEGE